MENVVNRKKKSLEWEGVEAGGNGVCARLYKRVVKCPGINLLVTSSVKFVYTSYEKRGQILISSSPNTGERAVAAHAIAICLLS